MSAVGRQSKPAGRGKGRRGRSPLRWALLVALVLAGALGVWAFTARGRPEGRGEAPAPAAAGVGEGVEDLVVEVLAAYPHDPAAYTQGLLWADGVLYESTGLYGESSLRRVDLARGAVLQRVDLPADLFGEGLALLPPRAGEPAGRLLQLTWKAGKAFAWDAASLAPRGSFSYRGEGWGLCWDGRRLVMSDGSGGLTFRDPEDFAATGRVGVRLRGRPVNGLNELECVGGSVYANVYTTSMIVRIDPGDGRVTATIDASGLLSADEAKGAEVLNGIAYNPTSDTFYITGKRWPKLFEVRFVPRTGG